MKFFLIKNEIVETEKFFLQSQTYKKTIVFIILIKKEVKGIMTNGKSAKKALMKTPINGARLSSPV